MHLMVQPEVAATALGDELLTKQGFMSRILACAPESLIGKRMHKSPPPEAAQVLQTIQRPHAGHHGDAISARTRHAKRA